MEIRYIVTHPFDYGDRHYQPGEVFEPTGSRRDYQIIDCGRYVKKESVPVEKRKKKAPKEAVCPE